MCKRSKKPLGKQQKKKRKNRKVREYEKIKMELTNLSPAERRRERILAEAEEKTAINTTPLTISVISMIFSWFAVFQSKIYEILKDWFQTLLEEYSNHAEIIQKIQLYGFISCVSRKQPAKIEFGSKYWMNFSQIADRKNNSI